MVSCVLTKTRATLVIHHDRVEKRFREPAHAQREADWYHRIPWACPRLLGFDGDMLTIERHPMADKHDLAAVLDLLHRLEAAGISHRDAWPGNIVSTPDGPRLIDWETAINQPGYDLHGPEASGVPIPDIHQAVRSPNSPHGYVMWWGSPHRASIRNQWGINLADLTEA